MPRHAVAAFALALALAACPRPASPPAALSNAPAPAAPAPAATDDATADATADAVGELRLEGQILDANDAPLGGARVQLSTRPPRTTHSEADGFFSFDALPGRRYTVSARTDDGRAARTDVEVTLVSEPVILRVR